MGVLCGVSGGREGFYVVLTWQRVSKIALVVIKCSSFR